MKTLREQGLEIRKGFMRILASHTPDKKLAVDSKGRLPTDLGVKDTVLVWPGEKVSVVVDFIHSFPGIQRYLLNCHNLEHADDGMMINYEVA